MKPSLANNPVQESYCTTAQFAKRDRAYHKHCGPTAITNLVLTLRPELAKEALRVFDEVAALGRSRWLIGMWLRQNASVVPATAWQVCICDAC